MGEGLGARPQALLNAGPVLAVPCPGGGRGYAPYYFFTRTRVLFSYFMLQSNCRALARAGIVKMWLQISAILRGI